MNGWFSTYCDLEVSRNQSKEHEGTYDLCKRVLYRNAFNALHASGCIHLSEKKNISQKIFTHYAEAQGALNDVRMSEVCRKVCLWHAVYLKNVHGTFSYAVEDGRV